MVMQSRCHGNAFALHGTVAVLSGVPKSVRQSSLARMAACAGTMKRPTRPSATAGTPASSGWPDTQIGRSRNLSCSGPVTCSRHGLSCHYQHRNDPPEPVSHRRPSGRKRPPGGAARSPRHRLAAATADRCRGARAGAVAADEGREVPLFRRLFRGRTDAYPIRWESKASGKSGYAPACANEWLAGVCEKPRIKCGDCARHRPTVRRIFQPMAWAGLLRFESSPGGKRS